MPSAYFWWRRRCRGLTWHRSGLNMLTGIIVKFFLFLNNHKQAMVVRAVFKMKDNARACIAVGGGVFEGRKV